MGQLSQLVLVMHLLPFPRDWEISASSAGISYAGNTARRRLGRVIRKFDDCRPEAYSQNSTSILFDWVGWKNTDAQSI
jgi:hypothetical protein